MRHCYVLFDDVQKFKYKSPPILSPYPRTDNIDNIRDYPESDYEDQLEIKKKKKTKLPVDIITCYRYEIYKPFKTKIFFYSWNSIFNLLF